MSRNASIVSRIPNAQTAIIIQPVIPIRLIAVLDLCLITSLKFQRVPNERRWNIFVFSINIGFIFFGEYALSASAAVPFSICLTERKPINVSERIITIIIKVQNHGIYNFHSGISKYVPIIPAGFIMYHAIK